MSEVWLPVPGYPRYEASSIGRIRSLDGGNVKGRMLKLYRNSNGYPTFTLCRNNTRRTTTVHRIVALTFIPNPENKPCINHKDGNKQNNDIKNLEWCTYQENIIHSFQILGHTSWLKGTHIDVAGKYLKKYKDEHGSWNKGMKGRDFVTCKICSLSFYPPKKSSVFCSKGCATKSRYIH